MSGQTHGDHDGGVVPVDRRAAAVRARNLIDDEEPESGAARARSGARERREGLPANGIGHRAAVLNLYSHFLRAAAVDAQDDGHGEIAVLDGVPQKVRQNLRNAIGIPCAVKVAAEVAFERRRRVHEFRERTFRQRPKVCRSRVDRQRAKPGRREVEKLSDEPRHPHRRRADAVGDLQRLLIVRVCEAQRFAGRENNVERVAEVVSQHADEQLSRLEQRAMFFHLGGQLLPLPEQLDEHVDLTLQQMRVDRLEQEVDGACFVTAEDPPVLRRASGDEDDRHPARPLGAAHQLCQLEAAHFRHLHVNERERHVVREQQLERLHAIRGPQHAHAGIFEQRLEHVEVVRHVIDGEDENRRVLPDLRRGDGA